MNITIVCGHYLPELGYLEVHLARALLKGGHAVSVVTSSAIPAYVRNNSSTQHKAGEQTIDGVKVFRLKPFISVGQIVWARGVRKITAQTKPDIVLAIGLGKVFPKPILNAGFRVGVLLGDNAHTFSRRDWRQRLIQRVVKKQVYRTGIQKARVVYTYTPETAEILGDWLGNGVKEVILEKQRAISLGFDANVFHFNSELRRSAREELGVDDETPLVISVARMGPNKNFTQLLDALSGQFNQGRKVKCVFIGNGDDDYSRQLRDSVRDKGLDSVVIFKPFMTHRELNRYYNGADIGFWPITAISIFEGMGTGLFTLVPDDRSLSHLALKGKNGLFFDSDFTESFNQALKMFNQIPRNERANRAVEKFAYDSIARIVAGSMKTD